MNDIKVAPRFPVIQKTRHCHTKPHVFFFATPTSLTTPSHSEQHHQGCIICVGTCTLNQTTLTGYTRFLGMQK